MNKPIQQFYFGARYYDPFFGMWLSPDPALVFFREVYAPLKCRDFIEKDILQRSNGEAVLLKHIFRASAQFANPYSYGGDPLNYVDLYGLWSIGFGFTVGWENGDFTAGVGGNLGYSYNTLSGSSLNYGLRGSICGAGIGVNGANYWNTSGSYMGGTISLEGFYGAFGAEAYAGYEWGYSGMNGREWYRGVRAFGFHVEYAQDGGFSWGGSVDYNLMNYEKTEGYSKLGLLNDYYTDEKAILSADYTYSKDAKVKEWGKYLKDDNPKVYSLMAHGDEYGVYLLNPDVSNLGYMTGDALGIALQKNGTSWNYMGEKTIKLYSCNTGRGEYNIAQDLSNKIGVTVIAPTAPIEARLVTQGENKVTSARIINGGKWKKFKPQY